MISLSNMNLSKHNSPTGCFNSLKSNYANDFLKIEEDLYGKPAAAMKNSDLIRKFVCSKNNEEIDCHTSKTLLKCFMEQDAF